MEHVSNTPLRLGVVSSPRGSRTRHVGFVLSDQGRESSERFSHDVALIVDALDDLSWRPVVKLCNDTWIHRLEVEDSSVNRSCLSNPKCASVSGLFLPAFTWLRS